MLEYASDLFDAASVAALGERLMRLLEAAVAAAAARSAALTILDAAERDTILRGWNDTAHSPAYGWRSGVAPGDGEPVRRRRRMRRRDAAGAVRARRRCARRTRSRCCSRTAR